MVRTEAAAPGIGGGVPHALAARDFSGDMAIVARGEAQGVALKRAGAPTVLYPFRGAVDFTVEHLSGLIRPERKTT